MKYKQTNITKYFGETKMKKSDEHKHSKSRKVIEISDDSDFENVEVVSFRKKKKIKLPYPISDDEDDVNESSIVTQVHNVKPAVQQGKRKKSNTNEKFVPEANSTPMRSNIERERIQSPFKSFNNSSMICDEVSVVNQPEILENSQISLRNKNEEDSTKNIKSMMLVNRPKKSNINNQKSATSSTPHKSNEQDDEQTLQNVSNNASTSSSDTIILSESAIGYLDDENMKRNLALSKRDGSFNKKQKTEPVEEMSQISRKLSQKSNAAHESQTIESYSVLKENLNLKVNIRSSVDREIQQGDNETELGKTNSITDSNSPAEQSKSPYKIIKLSPYTSRLTNFSSRKGSPVKASKKLFVSSSTPRSPTYKKNPGSPNKTSLMKNTKQVTSKKIVSLTEPSSSTCQSKANELELNTVEENESLNFKHLDCMKQLFQNSLEDEHQLLTTTDEEIIKKFLEMNVYYQYLLIKLFLYLPKWYNINKFCTKIKLDQQISTNEISEMYDYLKDYKFVDTDIISLELGELLDMLLIGDLKRICAKFKLGKRSNKKDIIETLKKNCRTQSTLSSVKSTEDLVKEAIVGSLGYCIKLRENIRITFYKAYLLQTFTNSLYLDPYKYLSDMNYLNITYPDYTLEEYNPFSNQEQFSSFYEAVLLKKNYYDASDKKNVVTMKNLCDIAFERLQNITNAGKFSRYLHIYLQRFSAEYQYISLLKTASKRLITYHETVKTWLQFLIENYPSHCALGFWYKQLAHIHVKYGKDYESAAQTVIRAFELNKSQNIFNLVELYDLSLLATRIRTTKSYKVGSLFSDKIAELSEKAVEYENFPKKIIGGQTDRSGKSGRRTYSFVDDNGEENYGNVEMIVLKYYEKEENFEGIHCEGRLIANLFALLFWDIIYCYYVPNTFISKYQRAPLDMYTDYFYKNRRTEIDQRMQDIAENWPSEKIEEFLKDNWDCHSQEESITNFNTNTTSFQDLLKMFKCINRKVLVDIFKRLVTNFKIFHSGLPDLFLWNSDTCKCKFVEVKGEGDKLSHKQILWIQYLIDIGANVEVCHVSGVGSRKLKAVEVDDL